MNDNADQIEQFGKLFGKAEPARPVVRRDSELQDLLQYLRPSPRSVLVIGPSGCGKTALIEAAARQIERPILSTTTSHTLIGTRYLGEWETRLKLLVDLCLKDGTLIYFSDICLLHQVGRTSQSDRSVGTFLLPYVIRGELALIGECTEEQYRIAVEDDATFGLQFQKINLSEASEADCGEMVSAAMRDRAGQFREQHGIELHVEESVKRAVLEESRMAFASISLPGRAIRLLDAMITEVVEPALRAEPRPDRVDIRPQTVIRVIEKLTGMSLRLLDESQPLSAGHVREWLETRVLGQPQAVTAVVDLIMMIKSGLVRPDRPISVMMFVGPTGVGKTELAKRLAEFVFGSDTRLIRFDMGEFQESDAVKRLAGSPWSNDATTRQGLLSAKVRGQPYSVVLFDEIEKASRDVYHLLLGIFDSGRLTDPQGRTTDFTRCIFIMTSNLGSDLTAHREFGLKPAEFDLQETITTSMASFFAPEFRGRITKQVLFAPLGLPHLRTLAQREIGKMLMARGIRRRNVHLEIDPSVYDHVLSQVAADPLGGTGPGDAGGGDGRASAVVPPGGVDAQRGRQRGADERTQGKGRGQRGEAGGGDRGGGRRQRARAVGADRAAICRAPVKLTRRSLDQSVADLHGRANHLMELCQNSRIDERKSELMNVTMRKDFWDEPAAAKRILTEIHRLDAVHSMLDAISAELDQLSFMKRDTAISLNEMDAIGRCVIRLQNRLDMGAYVLQFQDEPARCQAFVELRLMGQDTVKGDPAGRIAGMYAAWARNRGVRCVVLHEEIAEGVTRHVILLIEGVAMTGILANERGLHELHSPGKSRQRAASAFVEVSVLPRLEETPNLPAYRLVATRPQGKGKLARTYRSHTQIDCSALALKMSLRSELTPQQAKDVAVEYLASLLHVRHHAPERVGADRFSTEERPVRRYTLGHSANVKDYRSGLSRGGIDGVWKGQIDDLLQASMGTR